MIGPRLVQPGYGTWDTDSNVTVVMTRTVVNSIN